LVWGQDCPDYCLSVPTPCFFALCAAAWRFLTAGQANQWYLSNLGHAVLPPTAATRGASGRQTGEGPVPMADGALLADTVVCSGASHTGLGPVPSVHHSIMQPGGAATAPELHRMGYHLEQTHEAEYTQGYQGRGSQ
jgi:hypothetical protein